MRGRGGGWGEGKERAHQRQFTVFLIVIIETMAGLFEAGLRSPWVSAKFELRYD